MKMDICLITLIKELNIKNNLFIKLSLYITWSYNINQKNKAHKNSNSQYILFSIQILSHHQHSVNILVQTRGRMIPLHFEEFPHTHTHTHTSSILSIPKYLLERFPQKTNPRFPNGKRSLIIAPRRGMFARKRSRIPSSRK